METLQVLVLLGALVWILVKVAILVTGLALLVVFIWTRRGRRRRIGAERGYTVLEALIALMIIALVVAIVYAIWASAIERKNVIENCEPTPDTRWVEGSTSLMRVGDSLVPISNPGHWERRYVCEGDPFVWILE